MTTDDDEISDELNPESEPLEAGEAFFAEGPPVAPGPYFPDGEGACEVVLAEHPHPLCRMRMLIGFVRGTEMCVFEIEKVSTAGLIDMLLGKAKPSLTVKRADDFDELVVLRSFNISEDAAEAVVSAAHQYLTGSTPGLLPIAQAMGFFHFAYGVFETLRATANHPPVRIVRMGKSSSHPSILSTVMLPIQRPLSQNEEAAR